VSTVPAWVIAAGLVVGIVARSASAGPVPQMGTFKEYAALGSFDVGKLTFSNLSLTAGGALTDEQLMIQMLANGLEFLMNIMQSTKDGDSKTVAFSYKVSSNSGIVVAGLSFTGSAVDPDSKSQVTKTYRGTEQLTVFESTVIENGMNKTTSEKSKSVGFPDA